jgi:predicted ATP-grasp superfamily ATP-dependent carboligase
MALEYHEINPQKWLGRPMKGWKKDTDALEKRIEKLERDVKKCLAAARKRKRKKSAKASS